MNQTDAHTEPFKFTFYGDTVDYLRIHMVNLLLTIATFGVYLAWAKVRNRRYFYGNTSFCGQSFDFDANPLSIIRARLYVLAIVVVLLFSERIFILLWQGIGIMTLILLTLIPYALVRGRSFNAKHTTHRSVRFRYLRNYIPSYRLFIAYYLIGWIILKFVGELWKQDQDSDFLNALILAPLIFWFVLGPAYHYFRHSIMINQLRFGKLEMRYGARVMPYYRHFLVSILWATLVISILVAAALAFFTYVSPANRYYYDYDSFWQIIFLHGAYNYAIYSILLFSYLVIGVYRSRVIPMFYSSIQFDEGSHLSCNLSSSKYFFKYYVVNGVVFVMSLGFLYPWIRVRTWRLITESLTLHLSAETASVLSSPEGEVSPLAEEFADVQDVDIDFGLI